MEDRDFDPRDGEFTIIMNQFIDKLISYGLDTNEWKILMFIIRMTWGVRARAYADLSWESFIKATKLTDSSLAKAMRKLKLRNIIHTLENNRQITRYKINSKLSTWKDPSVFTAAHGSSNSLSPKAVTTASRGGKLLPPKAVVPYKDNIKDNIKDTPIIPIEHMTEKQKIEQEAKMVIDYINELSGKNFQYSQSSLGPIKGRLNDDYTVEQCFQVCQNKWNDPDLKVKYFRPTTLFRPSLFESYLNETGTKKKLSKQKTKMRSTVEAFARRHYERENPTKKN